MPKLRAKQRRAIVSKVHERFGDEVEIVEIRLMKLAGYETTKNRKIRVMYKELDSDKVKKFYTRFEYLEED